MAPGEPLRLVFRDDALAAIDKPPGLLVHRTNLDRHETRFALQLLRDQLGQRVYPVHRLDKGTSGVLLFALDAETVRAVTAQFESREVEKHYLAVVRGHIAEVGVIDHPLRDIAGTSDAAVSEARREAVTAFERVDAVELPVAVDRYPTSRYSLVRLRPRTGRQHQLRRHMHHVSHPIIGDTRYGKGVHNRFFREHFGCHRLLLACTRLELEHPVSGERLRLEAAPSGEFEALLAAMGWGGERSGR